METKKKNPLSDKRLFGMLFKYTKGYRHNFIIAFIMMAIYVVIDILIPILFGKTLEILGKDVIDYSKIIIIIILATGAIILLAVIQYFQALLLHQTGQKIVFKIREDVFSHIESLSIDQINKTPVGKWVTRPTNDVNALYEMYTNVFVNMLKSILTIIGVFIAMLVINVSLMIYILLLFPFIAALAFVFRMFSRKAHNQVRNNLSEVNAFLSENISGMKITQVFNQEDKKYKQFRQKNIALKRSSLQEIFVFAVFRPSIYVTYLVAVMIVLWFGGNDVINQYTGIIISGLTFATLYTFYQFIEKLFNPIQQLADQFNSLQSAFAASEKIYTVLSIKSDIVDRSDAIELDDVKGEIEFKNVWFKYEEDNWILKDVSFKIKANDTVAFVGATGSGKTTILSLIVRNYDIQKGQILIDGVDVQKIKLVSLRKNIGQMLQDVFLFSGTIFSNIQMREEDITKDEVIEAAKYVNAHTFIEKLPKEYDEVVRERGNNFSAGQRQLLSFARTLVHKPKIMILDEATANIDTETEVLIQDSLEKMMNIGTTLMVAHRLSTIQHANKIIVLQKGEIIEEGTHQELLHNKGHYYKLYLLQYQNNPL